VDGNRVNLFGVDNSFVVGQFVNILAVVIPVQEDPDFRRLAGQIQSRYFEALLHQHIPIVEIDAEFTKITGRSIHQLSDIAYNFLDLSAEWATDTSVRDFSGRSDGKSLTHNKKEIPVRAVEFANELHLEWELSCGRAESRWMIKDRSYLKKLDLLFHSILDTAEGIPADDISRNT
jgi:hypothetical protein